MSFSSLPTELIRQIIESSVASTFHSTTYDERQSTLSSLCLVSRRFLPIAQSMLFEIISIKDTTSLDDALDSAAEHSLSAAIHQVVIREQMNPKFEKPCFERLFSVCSSLKRLEVCSSSTINLSLPLLIVSFQRPKQAKRSG